MHLGKLCRQGFELVREGEIVALDRLEPLQQLNVFFLQRLVRGLDLGYVLALLVTRLLGGRTVAEDSLTSLGLLVEGVSRGTLLGGRGSCGHGLAAASRRRGRQRRLWLGKGCQERGLELEVQWANSNDAWVTVWC